MSAFPNGLTQYYANERRRRRECEVADKLSESQETSIRQIVNMPGFYEVNVTFECIYECFGLKSLRTRPLNRPRFDIIRFMVKPQTVSALVCLLATVRVF